MPIGVYPTEFLKLPGRHPGIVAGPGVAKPSKLNLPRLIDPIFDPVGRLPGPIVGKLPISDRRYLNVDVDSVQKGAGNPSPVSFNLAQRTSTVMHGVPKITARATARPSL